MDKNTLARPFMKCYVVYNVIYVSTVVINDLTKNLIPYL